MNAEIGTEAAQFPETGYINGIFVAVYDIFYLLPGMRNGMLTSSTVATGCLI
jgi:hypothetical protein